MTHDDGEVSSPAEAGAMTLDAIRTAAAVIAGELRAATEKAPKEPMAGTGGGSKHRGLPDDLRKRFVDLRAELYQRGIFDPVLARFDSATVVPASTLEIADELELVSAGALCRIPA